MPLRFTKVQISSETFEAAGVFDVNGDGIPDIVSGAFWYEGPDFRRKHLIVADSKRYADYYDDFSVIPMDIAGNGRIDYITGGWWGNSLRWRQNPADATKEWAEHTIAGGIGNVETTRAWDIDGDGELEIVPNTPNHPLCAYKLVRDAQGKPAGKFTKHELYPEGVGHGLGFGDVDGDGVGEFVTPKGILKRPRNIHPLNQPWTLVEPIDFGYWDLSVPVLVADINNDGANELIIGRAHNFGLSWYEQRRDSTSKGAGGKRTWHPHAIDPFASQYHDLQWADIDGDRQAELITGQRYRAHCGNDPGEAGPIGAYYFKWTGEGFSKHIIDYVHPGAPGGIAGGGVGIQFALADLRNTGRLDLIAPGKDGLFVYFNQGIRA